MLVFDWLMGWWGTCSTVLCCDLLCRGLTSLSDCEEAAKAELVECSTQQCSNLQAAAGDLLQTVDASADKLNTFSSHVTNFGDTMQEVGWLVHVVCYRWQIYQTKFVLSQNTQSIAVIKSVAAKGNFGHFRYWSNMSVARWLCVPAKYDFLWVFYSDLALV